MREDFFSKLIFIMVGYPGSGKSTLASKIVNHLDAHYLSSDQLRAELFGTSRYDKVGDKIISQQSKKAYQVMYQRAVNYAQLNQKVVLDATHLITEKRSEMIKRIKKDCSHKSLCFILVKTPYSIIEKRMRSLGSTKLQDWLRVYNIFKQKQQQNLISWPDEQNKQLKINCYLHHEIEPLLDQKN